MDFEGKQFEDAPVPKILNVAITFNQEAAAAFIALSKEINERTPSDIVLNERDQMPHLTLYSAAYAPGKENDIIERVEELARHTKSFPLILSSKSVSAGSLDPGYLFLDAETTPELRSLHEALIATLNPLRAEYAPQSEEGEPSPERYQKLYGMKHVKGLYLPHVTIAKPTDPTQADEALAVLPEHPQIIVPTQTISVAEQGPFGTCQKILRTVTLQSPDA